MADFETAQLSTTPWTQLAQSILHSRSRGCSCKVGSKGLFINNVTFLGGGVMPKKTLQQNPPSPKKKNHHRKATF